MENGHMKTGFFSQKVEPYLKPISDIGIGFYNLDENTAKLRFQLSNDTGTLLLSDNNLMVYGYFESSNGSVSDVIETEIIDSLNGIVETTLDQDFLHASTSTKVKGQLYIGVKNVDGKPEYNEVAVLGEFNFEVKDSLINKISSFTKIEYIRMFSQLKAQIEKEVQDIQEAIKNGTDYVAEMNTVKAQGITAINKTVTDGKSYIDSVITQSQTNINDTATSAISDVNTAKDNAISSMNTKVSESVGEVQNTSTGAITHVDEKLTEFNTHIEENGFVQPEDLDNKLSGLEWQKYKLTEDTGILESFSLADNLELLHAMKTGFYYRTAIPINNYSVSSKAGFLEVFERGSVKHILFKPYNSKRQFLKRFYNTWNDWEEITVTQTDTGWIPFQLINGAISNTEFNGETSKGFDCAYRIVKNGNVTTKTLRLNGRQLTQGQIIAQLPNNLFEYAHSFPVRVPTSTSYFGGYITMRPTGEVRFYINGDSSSWNTTTGYLYGEYSWVE